MMFKNKITAGTLACIIGMAAFSTSTPTMASKALGGFIGGMVVGKVLHNMHEQSKAEKEQAYYAQQQAQRPVAAAPAAPAAPAQLSPEARIKQLDKLAAGGYITPAEYKQKKKAIIDSM
jgi:hypothetical protein